MIRFLVVLIIILSFSLNARSQEKFYDDYMIEIESLYQKGRTKEAIKVCDEAIAKYGIDADLAYLRGFGESKDIKNDYQFYDDTLLYNNICYWLDTAIILDSTKYYALELRGGVNYNFNFFESLEDYTRTLWNASNKRERITAWGHIAAAKTMVKDTVGALEAGQKVIELDPDNTDAYVRLSSMYIEFGDYHSAETILIQALRNDPENELVLCNLGYICLRMEHYKRAIEYYDQAEELNDKNVLVYSNRGYCNVMLGNYKKGLKDINKSIKLNPTNPYAYKYRAVYYIKTGDPGKACQDLNLAIEYGYQVYDNEVDLLIEEHCK